jgi:hypothetical protein
MEISDVGITDRPVAGTNLLTVMSEQLKSLGLSDDQRGMGGFNDR